MSRPFSLRNVFVVPLCALLSSAPGLAQTRYVWQHSPNPVSPFYNWATVAQDIRAAMDAALDAETVLVTNGVYASGGTALFGTMTNRVASRDSTPANAFLKSG